MGRTNSARPRLPAGSSPSSSPASASCGCRALSAASSGAAPRSSSSGSPSATPSTLSISARSAAWIPWRPSCSASCACSRPRDHDGVGADRQPLRLPRERLAQQTLDAVALDGAADLPRYRQAEPRWLIASAREHVQHEITAGMRPAVSHHAIEVSASGKPPTARRTCARHGPPTPSGACGPCRGAA